MKVSLLNEKILFQKSAVVSDAIGIVKMSGKIIIPVLPPLVEKVEMRNWKPDRQQMVLLSLFLLGIVINWWTSCPQVSVFYSVGRFTTFFLLTI